MSNSYSKIEIENESSNFRRIANRVLTSDYTTFDDNLKRLINCIDKTHIIKEYIDSCSNDDDNFDVKSDLGRVHQEGFKSFIDENKEVSYTYQVLKYITENDLSYVKYVTGYSISRQFNDMIKAFNDNFILPFINEINGNYERICVEMGLDKENKYCITIRGEQVNIAKDNSIINAVQNNYSEVDKLVCKIKSNIDTIDNSEIKSEIIDNVEGLQEELKKENPKRGIINSLTGALKTILPQIPTAIETIAAITDLINFAQQFIK